MYDGIHEEIVSEEIWNLARKKREATGGKTEKIYHPERVHLLSGLLKCPICGASLYGNVNRKRKKDGKDYYYYACKHRLEVDGHKCSYKKQWEQGKVNAAVEEVILKLVQNPKFENAIREKIGARIDTSELEQKISEKQVYQFLLYFDKLYDKFTDAEKKEFLNSFIERVELHENELPDGRFLKCIIFRFHVFFDGRETSEIGWDSEATVESVMLLSKK